MPADQPRPQVVVPDDYPALFGGPEHPELRRLARLAEVSVHGTRWRDREELYSRVATAEAVINVRSYSRFDAETFSHARRLRIVSVVGTGVDNVDLAAAAERGIFVCNTPAVASEAVAELGLGLMLAVARGIAAADRGVRAGAWAHPAGMEVRGKTLGLIGLGSVGRHMAALGLGIGMNVIGWTRSAASAPARAPGVELVGFDDVFRRSDVISVHLRSTPETAGRVGARELGLMRPGAILVNTARAAVVDYAALAGAIRAGRLAGAGLDVHTAEPLPVDQNLFADLDNVVLTPHLGSVTEEANERSIRESVENVVRFLQGSPRNAV